MTASDHHIEASGHGRISDMVYIKVAVSLAVLTAVEVFTYFESVHKAPDWLLILVLVGLMVIKFFLVAAYFMHLKYENAVFTKFIVGGLVIAYPVYMVMAYASEWLPEWNGWVKAISIVVPPVIASAWLLFAWQGGDHDHAHDSGN